MSQQGPPDYRDEIKDCYKSMSTRVHAALRRLTQGDDPLAEDVLHETFIKAWKNWPVLRELTGEERVGWLIQVAVNTAIDVFRHNETAREKMPEVWACYHPPESDAQQEALRSMAVQHFIEVINAMPPQRGRVAFLALRCGWPNSEIARKLGITPGRVSQHLKAARETLREELGPYVPLEGSEPEGGVWP